MLRLLKILCGLVVALLLAATGLYLYLSATLPSASIDRSLPVGPFSASSTALEVTEGLDLSGKVALVTGCNSGLGYETMRALAMRGAHVIGTGRTLEKARRACDSVEGQTTPLQLELSDIQSVLDCARRVKELGVELDMLIANAGASAQELQLIDGIEKLWLVNFLGHFVLVNELVPHMSPRGRIVHVSSEMSYLAVPPGGIDFENLRGEGEFNSTHAYGRSKLANALFSLELAERLQGTGVTSNAVHPGRVKTNIMRGAPAVLLWLYENIGSLVLKSAEQGAATQVYVASHPTVEGVTGAFFEDCNPVRISGEHHLYDTELAKKLWEVAEEMRDDLVR